MSDTTGVYHVLLQNGAPANWQPVAAIASACAPKIAKVLVIKTCRFGHGLLRLMLTHDEAQDLATKLTAAKIPAIALPIADLVQPPPPFTLLRVELSDAALMIQVGATTVFQPLPWESIRMLHVGCTQVRAKPITSSLEVDQGTSVAAIGLSFVAMGGVMPMAAMNAATALGNAAKEKMSDLNNAPTETEILLEILTLAPLLRLRIRMSKFSYDFLGEKRQPTARANFALALAEVKARALNAAGTGLFSYAVGGRRIEPEKYTVDESDHEQQLSVLLTIESKFGLPRG